MSRVAQYDDVKGAASAARHLALHSLAAREPHACTPPARRPHAARTLVLHLYFSKTTTHFLLGMTASLADVVVGRAPRYFNSSPMVDPK